MWGLILGWGSERRAGILGGSYGTPSEPARSAAVFVVFSFTSIVDLIISLEEDGFISGFMEIYVREVPSPPSGAPAHPGFATNSAAHRGQAPKLLLPQRDRVRGSPSVGHPLGRRGGKAITPTPNDPPSSGRAG